LPSARSGSTGSGKFGPLSPIHLLAVLVLVVLPIAVWKAHSHEARRASPRHAPPVLPGASDRRSLHAAARTHQAQGGVRQLLGGLKKSLPEAAFPAAPRQSAREAVSLWKNEGKKRRF
jgi:hypothetical protein